MFLFSGWSLLPSVELLEFLSNMRTLSHIRTESHLSPFHLHLSRSLTVFIIWSIQLLRLVYWMAIGYCLFLQARANCKNQATLRRAQPRINSTLADLWAYGSMGFRFSFVSLVHVIFNRSFILILVLIVRLETWCFGTIPRGRYGP